MLIQSFNAMAVYIYIYIFFLVCRGQTENGRPALAFTADMNQHVVSETTKTGTVVYTLQAAPSATAVTDDESSTSIGGGISSSSLRFFIRGTDVFAVNETTGDVTLTQSLDREVCDSRYY